MTKPLDLLPSPETFPGLLDHYYAGFLDEAAGILGRPVLESAAKAYRKAGESWTVGRILEAERAAVELMQDL